ncbi:MAG: hypothetical protein ABJD07_01635 [Gemmatimonadaceae bacterium]
MRRLLCCLVVAPLIAACAKSDTAVVDTAKTAPVVAATPAPEPGAKFVGTWMVHSVTTGAAKKDTGNTFMTMMDASGNSMQPMGKDTVRYHRLSMTDSTLVMESTPHRDPMMKAEVVTHVEGKMMGDSMAGTWMSKATGAKAKSVAGTWTAHKAP